jgi:hypothetical protein
MTPELLADELVPIAAELIGCVYQHGPDAVASVLARVPDGRHDALAVVLAAMVDPTRTVRELLAWTDCGLEYHRLVAAGVSHRAASVLVSAVAS